MTPSQPQQVLSTLPTAPTPPPVFGSDPIGSKPKPKSSQTTFLGASAIANPAAIASASGSGKTLLGQ